MYYDCTNISPLLTGSIIKISANMVLEHFLQDLHDVKCPFQLLNQNEIDDLESAIHEMIQVVFQKMFDRDHRLCFPTMLPTGGFYEGAKILNPDEFDFMAIWDAASSDKEFELEKSCPGCVILKPKFEDHWLAFVQDGKFLFASNLNDSSVLTFSKYFDIGIRSEHNESVKEIITRENGNLQLIGTSSRYLTCSWESPSDIMSDLISIDIMPCIQVPDCSMVEILHDVPKDLHKYVQKDGCHVVPKKCTIYSSHFRSQISFSRVELHMVLDMSDHHIKCYKILKYVGHLVSALCFDSFVLKNAILHHCFRLKCSEYLSLGSCTIQVYEYLRKCSEDRFLPYIFRPDKNIQW